ncbi:hypothetical protein NIES4071_91050 [Calothrix sp. NIES-4071]|nr:hypothetical protein NIES4071_91050 [Calothrix sp. NIES-4071]BAZ63372.1 hypothetical protein NIES4105_90980 [Calothrix sp. NIES-4105]
MVKQSFFLSDTDTFLGFPQHLNQLTNQDLIGVPKAAPYDVGYLNPPALIIPTAADDGNEVSNAKILDGANCVCLNLETLKCFEVVERQYEDLGVIFSNCIAIQPSNPAFPSHSGAVVLMGAPKGGFLEVAFVRPVNIVKALVTSSQRLLLSAYNRERKIVAQEVLPVGNLANSDSALPPNKQLKVKAEEISSITFCAFDGQFTLDNFSFCS